ncbi:MAG: FAD:protein FMN transferase [Phycisphaerales bacterium JB039]
MTLPDPPGAQTVIRLAIAAMGTRFELALCAADAARARAIGELALEEIRLAHERLSAFQPQSLVSRINRRAGAGWTVVDPDTLALLEQARDVHARSGGAFDITLGPLMRAWGFRDAECDAGAASAARRLVGMGMLAIDAPSRRVALAQPGAELDLGAIAKGHALDLAGAILRAHGVRNCLLHAGTSTALALGAPPGASGWRVALADRGRRLGPVVTLRNQTLSVSSPSGRTIRVDGAAHGHVLDPRAGAPAAGAQCACAILPAAAGACAGADAWSTALLVCAARPPRAPAELTSLTLARHGASWRIDGPASSTVSLTCDQTSPRHAGAREEIPA